MDKLDNVLDKIEKLCDPVSIFLYGSRARLDFLENSDYEIGVLMYEDKYTGRSEIKKAINEGDFSIYPFRYEEFLAGKIDTPFQKSIYLYELISVGKTLRGEKVVEKMDLPAIYIVDLMQEIRFCIGFSLAAVISYRNGDSKTASVEFYKSCLFGLGALGVLEMNQISFSYEDKYNLSKEINLGEYEQLASRAYSIRVNRGVCEEVDLFKNISFLNEFVEIRIVEEFTKGGNVRLI